MGLFALVVLVLVSCGPRKSNEPTGYATTDTVGISGKSVDEIAKAPDNEKQSKSKDSTTRWFDTIAYRFDEPDFELLVSTGNLLYPGTFHNNEVWDSVAQQRWLGLFQRNNLYTLEQVTPHVKTALDIVLDENGDSTGWEVTFTNQDSCIILINDTALNSDTVTAITHLKNALWPQDTFRFDYADTTYELVVRGHKLQVSEKYFEVKNYELVFRQLNGATYQEQVLLQLHRLDDSLIEVLWLGDLNKDGKPDLLIETSYHYNMVLPTLFLSGNTKKGELLREFGKFRSVGC